MAGSCSLEQGQPLLLTAQIRSCKPAPERFWIPLRLSLPTVAPGQFPGALRFVSLALHILPQWAEGTAGTFQRGKFPNTHCRRKRVSLKLNCKFATRNIAQKTHSTQQAWMYSRNQTTIASACKHRQPVFLHPTKRRHGNLNQP